MMQRRARLTKSRERHLRDDYPEIKIVGRLTYDTQPEPDREVSLGDYLADGTGDRLVDAYLDGAAPDELGAIFAESIGDAPFYKETFHPYNEGHLQWDVDYIEGWGG